MRKTYGASKIDKCPFCGKQAIISSKDGIPVCTSHKESKFPDMKCACGSWLDLKSGKWGPYFQCIKCGNKNFRQILEINEIKEGHTYKTKTHKTETQNQDKTKTPSPKRTETTIRSDDPTYFD